MTTSKHMTSSQIRKNAFSAFQPESSWASLYPVEESKQITVASEVPLNDIINNRDATGRIAKWAIELLPFDITYRPQRAIKSQGLADFVAEWMEAELLKEYGTYSN